MATAPIDRRAQGSLRGKRSPGTRQVNLALTASQEELVRLLVLRLREGGLEFEQRVREFVQEAPVPRYMHIDELDRRFGALERRILHLEETLDSAGTADQDS
jgi:hypothetical protein